MSRSKRNFDIPLPAVDLRQMVEAALSNVDYHLSIVVALLKGPGLSTLWQDDPSIDESTKHNLQGQVNRFHAHLRGFLWETIAAYEAMWVWAKKQHSRSKLIPELEEIRGTDWYTEVNNYRNHAHKSFLVAEGLFSTQDRTRGSIPIMLVPGRPGGMQTAVPDGLVTYRDNIHKLFQKLLSM